MKPIQRLTMAEAQCSHCKVRIQLPVLNSRNEDGTWTAAVNTERLVAHKQLWHGPVAEVTR